MPTDEADRKAREIVTSWHNLLASVYLPPAVREQLAQDIAAVLAKAHRDGAETMREACAKASRRPHTTPRGWIPEQSTFQTDAELYSALREGQEIAAAIHALPLPPPAEGEG
jgi:hypothetical protein